MSGLLILAAAIKHYLLTASVVLLNLGWLVILVCPRTFGR